MSMPILRPLPNESWDCMLPGPPSRHNFGSTDLSPSGLLAFASGSSVSVIDSRSLQLVTAIPLPPLSSSLSGSSPFNSSTSLPPLRHLCALDPTPSPPRPSLHRTVLFSPHHRRGGISLLDFHLHSLILSVDRPDPSSKSGIRDLCWVQARPNSFLLASLSGLPISLFTTLPLLDASSSTALHRNISHVSAVILLIPAICVSLDLKDFFFPSKSWENQKTVLPLRNSRFELTVPS